jgi:hypothetical protein
MKTLRFTFRKIRNGLTYVGIAMAIYGWLDFMKEAGKHLNEMDKDLGKKH